MRARVCVCVCVWYRCGVWSRVWSRGEESSQRWSQEATEITCHQIRKKLVSFAQELKSSPQDSVRLLCKKAGKFLLA